MTRPHFIPEAKPQGRDEHLPDCELRIAAKITTAEARRTQRRGSDLQSLRSSRLCGVTRRCGLVPANYSSRGKLSGPAVPSAQHNPAETFAERHCVEVHQQSQPPVTQPELTKKFSFM